MDSSEYQQIEQDQRSNAVIIEMDVLQVGSEPVGMRCPNCNEDIMSTATYKNTSTTHFVALLLCIFCWCLCGCILPYVTKRWKNVEHHCPYCTQFLGVYTRKRIT